MARHRTGLMALRILWLAVAILLAGPPAAAAPASTESVEASEARETFDSLFGREAKQVRRTPALDDDVALAKRLLSVAREATASPAFVALLCDEAWALASPHAVGESTAVAAMDLLAKHVPSRASEAKERIGRLRGQSSEAPPTDTETPSGTDAPADAPPAQPPPATPKDDLDALLAQVEVKTQAGDFIEAAALNREALALARRIHDDRLWDIREAAEVLARRINLERRARDVRAMLERRPDNVDAREGLVRLYLVNLDDPKRAAEVLEGVEDPDLKKYVPAAAKPLDKAPELACLELGEWYVHLAGRPPEYAQPHLYARAKAYLDRFLSRHEAKDMTYVRAKMAMEKVEAALRPTTPTPAEDTARTAGTEEAEPGVEPGAPAGEPAGGAEDTPSPDTAGRFSDGSVPPGRWVALLPRVDARRDALRGQWEYRAGTLTNLDHSACLALPVAPKGSYEVEAVFRRTDGNDAACIYLPVGSNKVVVILSRFGGSVSALGQINNKDIHDSAAHVSPGTLENDRDYTVTARVVHRGAEVEIRVTLDGTTYLQWQGPPSALNVPKGWTEGPLIPLGRVGLTVQEALVRWQRLRFRLIEGEARLVRPPQTAVAAQEAPASEPAEAIAPPPDATLLAPDQWVDLGTRVTADDIQLGTWRGKDGRLVRTAARDAAALRLPVVLAGDYQLQARFTRTAGTDTVALILPVGRWRVAAVFSQLEGTGSGLDRIAGKPGIDNASTVRPAAMENGRPYHVLATVKGVGREEASIDIHLDGKQHIHWSGPPSALGVAKPFRLTPPQCPGVGAWHAAVAFEDVRVRLLAGQAWLLQPEEGAADTDSEPPADDGTGPDEAPDAAATGG